MVQSERTQLETQQAVTRGAEEYETGSILLGTYRIESAPVHGGMGSVWRVRHMQWDTDLAMKRPQASMFLDDAARANFVRECSCWIDLGVHPNIVSCYYVRVIDSVPAIFSEWMDGGSLGDWIRDGRLYAGEKQEQEERILDIAVQFARGLRYAHACGVIHQDVKPDNLLLNRSGQARMADFGLARARRNLALRERPADHGGTVMTPAGGYTPAYCSMEQMDGKEVTRRTDIYSWAVSVMEMFLGTRPWMNGVVAGMNCRDYFRQTRVPMPERLADLLACCMEMEPRMRPHDFETVEKELEEIWQDVAGRPYPRPEAKAAPGNADSLNNRALSYLDLGMPEEAEKIWNQISASSHGHSASLYNRTLYAYRRGGIPGDRAAFDIIDCLIHTDSSEEFLTGGARFLAEIGPTCESLLNNIFLPRIPDRAVAEEIRKGMVNRTPAPYMLSRIATLSEQEREDERFNRKAREIRGFMDQGRYAEACVIMNRLIHREKGFSNVFYRPDWQTLNDALGRKCHPFSVLDSVEEMCADGLSPDDGVSFSQDGTLLLCGRKLYRVSDHRLLFEPEDEHRRCIVSCLSPDGSFYLRVIPGIWRVEKVNARTGEILAHLEGTRGMVFTLALSPDGTVLAAADMDGVVHLWDADGRKCERYECGDTTVHEIQISLNNRYVLVRTSGQILRIDRETQLVLASEELEDADGDAVQGMCANLQFERAVVICRQGEARIFDPDQFRVIRPGPEETRMTNIRCISFAPNDCSVFFAAQEGRDRYVIRMGLPQGLMSTLVCQVQGNVFRMAVSRDWKHVVYSDGHRAHLLRCVLNFAPPWSEDEDRKDIRARFLGGLPETVSEIMETRFDILEEQNRFTPEHAGSHIRAYALLMHRLYPQKSAEELEELLSEDLAARGYGSVGQDDIRRLLREVCATGGRMPDILGFLEMEARRRMKEEKNRKV